MSKLLNEPRSWPTEDEIQAAMRVGRRLRAEAFAEFFGFGVSAKRKAESKAAEQAGDIRSVAPAGC